MNVLIIDSDRSSNILLEQIINENGHSVDSICESITVVEMVLKNRYDVIFLDVHMPILSGFEVLKNLKSMEATRNIPVIMLSADVDNKNIRRALEAGANDYIKKPFEDVELIARLQSAYKNKLYEEMLQKKSVKDPLTDLYNHEYIIETVMNEYERCKRGNEDISFLMLDLDYFKKVNDEYGHQAGDFVLIETVKRIKKNIRKYDTFGRYGGEEFSILITGAGQDIVMQIAERIRQTIENESYTFENNTMDITVSIGICHINFQADKPDDDFNYKDLIKIADDMLYKAKKNGRNQCTVNSSIEV